LNDPDGTGTTLPAFQINAGSKKRPAPILAIGK
jgi:hypothetical protein